MLMDRKCFMGAESPDFCVPYEPLVHTHFVPALWIIIDVVVNPRLDARAIRMVHGVSSPLRLIPESVVWYECDCIETMNWANIKQTSFNIDEIRQDENNCISHPDNIFHTIDDAYRTINEACR